jgi:hypothetical protein
MSEKPRCECIEQLPDGTWTYRCECSNGGDAEGAASWCAYANSAAELSRLKAENERLQGHIDSSRFNEREATKEKDRAFAFAKDCVARAENAEAEVATLKARVEELERVLKPFADVSNEGVIPHGSKGHVRISTCAEYFHEAALALKEAWVTKGRASFWIVLGLSIMMQGAAGYERYMLQGATDRATFDALLHFAGCIMVFTVLKRLWNWHAPRRHS